MTADTITAIKKALEKVYIGGWYISGVKTNGLSVVHNAADSSMFGITAETFEAEYVVAANPFAISELLSTLESLQRENEELRQDRADLADAIAYGLDNPAPLEYAPAYQLVDIAMGDHRRLELAEDEVKRLRESLKPFADLAPSYDPPEDDDDQKCWHAESTPTIGDLRRARASLSSTGDTHGN